MFDLDKDLKEVLNNSIVKNIFFISKDTLVIQTNDCKIRLFDLDHGQELNKQIKMLKVIFKDYQPIILRFLQKFDIIDPEDIIYIYNKVLKSKPLINCLSNFMKYIENAEKDKQTIIIYFIRTKNVNLSFKLNLNNPNDFIKNCQIFEKSIKHWYFIKDLSD